MSKLGKYQNLGCPHLAWLFLPWTYPYIIFLERFCQSFYNRTFSIGYNKDSTHGGQLKITPQFVLIINILYLSTFGQLGESWTCKSWGMKTCVFESKTFNSPDLLKYGINTFDK
jgi:hypothetical protein